MPQTLADAVRRAERRTEALRGLAEIQTADPALFREIVEILTGNGHVPPVSDRGDRRASAASDAFEAVRRVLLANPTEWIDTPTLRERTGLTKPVLAYALKSNADALESRPHPTHGRKVQFRLKAPAMNQ